MIGLGRAAILSVYFLFPFFERGRFKACWLGYCSFVVGLFRSGVSWSGKICLPSQEVSPSYLPWNWFCEWNMGFYVKATGALDYTSGRDAWALASYGAEVFRSWGSTTCRSEWRVRNICRGCEETYTAEDGIIAYFHPRWCCPIFNLLSCDPNVFTGGIPRELGKLRALRLGIMLKDFDLGGECLCVFMCALLGFDWDAT